MQTTYIHTITSDPNEFEPFVTTTSIPAVLKSVLFGTEAQKLSALRSLGTDKGLKQLVPYFVQFIAERVERQLAVPSTAAELQVKEPHNLYVLSSAVSCAESLIMNPHLELTTKKGGAVPTHQLELYLHQLLPPLLSCVVCARLGAHPTEDHWSLRQRAATLVGAISARFSSKYVDLPTRIAKCFTDALWNTEFNFAAKCGAVLGIQSLGHIPVGLLLLPQLHAFVAFCESRSVWANRNRVERLEAEHCLQALLSAVGQYVQDAASQIGTRHPQVKPTAQRLGKLKLGRKITLSGGKRKGGGGGLDHDGGKEGGSGKKIKLKRASSGVGFTTATLARAESSSSMVSINSVGSDMSHLGETSTSSSSSTAPPSSSKGQAATGRKIKSYFSPSVHTFAEIGKAAEVFGERLLPYSIRPPVQFRFSLIQRNIERDAAGRTISRDPPFLGPTPPLCCAAVVSIVARPPPPTSSTAGHAMAVEGGASKSSCPKGSRFDGAANGTGAAAPPSAGDNKPPPKLGKAAAEGNVPENNRRRKGGVSKNGVHEGGEGVVVLQQQLGEHIATPEAAAAPPPPPVRATGCFNIMSVPIMCNDVETTSGWRKGKTGFEGESFWKARWSGVDDGFLRKRLPAPFGSTLHTSTPFPQRSNMAQFQRNRWIFSLKPGQPVRVQTRSGPIVVSSPSREYQWEDATVQRVRPNGRVDIVVTSTGDTRTSLPGSVLAPPLPTASSDDVTMGGGDGDVSTPLHEAGGSTSPYKVNESVDVVLECRRVWRADCFDHDTPIDILDIPGDMDGNEAQHCDSKLVAKSRASGKYCIVFSLRSVGRDGQSLPPRKDEAR
jgi:hypothetical protein